MTARFFDIAQHEFSVSGLVSISTNHYANNLWPMVYILSDSTKKRAYVGESTDILSRINTHLKNAEKNQLKTIHLISSEKFNKSAALDIESNLIRYIAADGQFELLNGNLGLANHNYYQKTDLYWKIFTDIWNDLRAKGVAKGSLEFIDNSDIFKYSPYKSLSVEQEQGLHIILKCLLNEEADRVLIEGGAGTGKTILAIFLFKMLNAEHSIINDPQPGATFNILQKLVDEVKAKSPNLKMGLVVPMSSFRKTLKNVFRSIKGLNADMVIGPADVATKKYDLLIIDESHRLRQRVNLGAYFGAYDKASTALGLDKHHHNELDWVLKQSKKTILFYDQDQSIKPSDVSKEAFDQLKAMSTTRAEKLKSQFRVKGGNAYVQFIDGLLNSQPHDASLFASKDYELTLFESPSDMINMIKKRDAEYGLSRLIAGYAWRWISKADPSAFDIEIGDERLRWNSTPLDWINSTGAVHEVGCIHTTQGYDLNYSGIIFGHEIGYDPISNKITINAENYFDKNGKQSIKDPEELKKFIINIYKTILLRAIKGTYIYVCDPHLREYFSKYIPTIKAKNKTPTQIIRMLTLDKVRPYENSIPLYDLSVAAGSFSEPQEIENIDWITLPAGYKPSNQLFACKVIGESMNRIIPNGSICLFRKDPGGSRNGKIVLVEHADIYDIDSGNRYTVKEYESHKTLENGTWKHEFIRLKPVSNDPSYKELILTNEQANTFKVIGIFEKLL